MSRIAYIRQDGKVNGIDFDAHYQVKGWRGIAFYLLGWAVDSVPVMAFNDAEEEIETGEYEGIPNQDCVVAVMVGDDRRHVVDVSDLIPLAEDGFCRDCGQVGCHCNVYV